MKLFMESDLKDHYELSFLQTNFRSSNVNKGRLDKAMMLAFFRFFFQLLREMIFHRPKLAYYPITATQIGWVGRDSWCLLICRLFHVKTVLHLRGSHLKLNLRAFHPQVRALVKFACRGVSLALVQAECLKDQFEGLVAKEKIKVLTQAIDTRKFENSSIQDYNPMHVLFMGHMTKAKGYCDLVRAIPKVAKKYPDVRFLFAGTMRHGERNVFFNQASGKRIDYEDPFEAEKKILASSFAKNYENLGIIIGEDKVQHLRKMSVFILPSYSEGFSRSLLEAMCMGKPVICTSVGAHIEAVKDGEHGLVVLPGDVDGLAKAIINMLGNKSLRDAIAARNYEYVRKTYGIEKVATEMKNLLDTVIRSGV